MGALDLLGVEVDLVLVTTGSQTGIWITLAPDLISALGDIGGAEIGDAYLTGDV